MSFTYWSWLCAGFRRSTRIGRCTLSFLPCGGSLGRGSKTREECLRVWFPVSKLVWRSFRFKTILTRIDTMKIVEIGCEPKAFDRAFDVGFDVLGGVGDGHAIFEHRETALGGNWSYSHFSKSSGLRNGIPHVRKILSRTLCFLMKSPRSFSLTPAW
jgi:hypothetical protein